MHHDQNDPDNSRLLNMKFMECQVQYFPKSIFKVQCRQLAVFQFQWIISVKCKDHSRLTIADICCVTDNPEGACS